MNNIKTIAVVGVLAALAGAWLGTAGLRQGAANPQTSTIAPTGGQPHSVVTEMFAQSLPDAAGATQPLGQWKGKALLVNFWAPWCAPCVKEMPELSALAQEQAGKHLQVIGIGIDSASNIAEFANRIKIQYPVYVAGMSGTELARQFGNSAGGLPYTVLIGADGQVKKTYLGKLNFAQLKADLAALRD